MPEHGNHRARLRQLAKPRQMNWQPDDSITQDEMSDNQISRLSTTPSPHSGEHHADTPNKRLPRIGDRVELLIEDLAFGGDGVGRVDEYVVFVPFVIPGERIEAKITECKRSYTRGVLAEVLVASPH